MFMITSLSLEMSTFPAQRLAYTKDGNLSTVFVNLIYQGLFCHDQVSSGKFLEFFNLWRNLQMFLDTMEPRTENKNSSLEKTVLIMWAQIA